MTQMWDCTEARPSLGVYVLGSIDPAERGQVDAHLATCQECRDELAGLAGLPALLARLTPDEVSRISADDPVWMTSDEPPAELIGTVLDLAKAKRRRERWRYVSAAAAVVVLAGGAFAGVKSATTRTHDVPVPSGSEHSWEIAQGSSQAASVTVAYSDELWGNAFEVLVQRIPTGTTCQLWVVHPDGTRTQVAAWTTAGDEGHVWYAGSMATTAGAISQFQITANHQVLVTANPT
ncbi:MAG: anti-sigma factor family protein [Streptosporangiaceae bacterium]